VTAAIGDLAGDLIQEVGYAGLVVLMAVEHVFPPIPSELVLPLAGFEVGRGNLSLVGAVASSTAGSLIGASTLYALARRGGRPLILRLRAVLGIGEDDLDDAERRFRRHSAWIVLLGRMVPGLRSAVSLPPGLLRMPFRRYLALTATGSLVWNTLLIVAGQQLGSRWSEVSDFVGPIAQWVLVAIIPLTVVALVVRRRRRRRAPRAYTRPMLGLPDGVTALLFDLDGVLTQTAKVHQAAWKEMFDGFLRERDGDGFRPFEPDDYNRYVDGMPRYDGVRGFLESRTIEHDEALVRTLGDRKNDAVQRKIRRDGVEVYEGSRRYLEAARDAGLRRAVVSSSANTEEVLEVTGLAPLVEVRVDGVVAQERGLPGKPQPDTFVEGARLLGAEPAQAAVFEDALAGVQAGRAGNFGAVIGVDRVGQADALREHGADRVVADLDELLDER